MSCHKNSYNYPETQNNNGAYVQNGAQKMQQTKPKNTRNMQTNGANGVNAAGAGTLTNATPIYPPEQQPPSTVMSTYYTAGFLSQFLGRNMRVEFLIGTGALIDRVGVLIEVGASYIVLQPYSTDDILMCDLYSIKFVYIYL